MISKETIIDNVTDKHNKNRLKSIEQVVKVSPSEWLTDPT